MLSCMGLMRTFVEADAVGTICLVPGVAASNGTNSGEVPGQRRTAPARVERSARPIFPEFRLGTPLCQVFARGKRGFHGLSPLADPCRMGRELFGQFRENVSSSPWLSNPNGLFFCTRAPRSITRVLASIFSSSVSQKPMESPNAKMPAFQHFTNL